MNNSDLIKHEIFFTVKNWIDLYFKLLVWSNFDMREHVYSGNTFDMIKF
jgi:hypothetical protein